MKRFLVFCGAVAALLAIDHVLAHIAHKRIAARQFDFPVNYDPAEIDWEDKHWRHCWERRELVVYKYKTCLRSAIFLDPPEGVREKLYYYRWPQSWISSINKAGDGFNHSPTTWRPMFAVNELGSVSGLDQPEVFDASNIRIYDGLERFRRVPLSQKPLLQQGE